ncbi:hypothetical protein D1BOALGB6SA_6184 [Olavius sp. associated proteobacterium Delta 1]|nr:hypothetical protein D1BOALGB6SA_6184 [Olavius sp. associated proteobacterium Delta 1]
MNIESASGGPNIEFAALYLFLIDRIQYSMLDVQCSMFDVH